jgi:outer membrane protein assembly factor BamA
MRMISRAALAPLLALAVSGQTQEPPAAEPPPGVTTRTGWLESLRDEKAATLQPQVLSKTEEFLNRFGSAEFISKLEGYTGGFRPIIGNQYTGSGFAGGVGWRSRKAPRNRIGGYVTSSWSIRGWQRYDAGFRLPELLGGALELDVDTGYRNSNSLSYFGPGPAQRFRRRTNFRLEETHFDGRLSWRVTRHLRVGAIGGYLLYNVGPGQDPRFASVDETYPPELVPGLDRQSYFVRTGGEIQLDFRDFPPGPKRGSNWFARYANYNDTRFGAYSFQRIDLRATKYFPFFNDRRVIVVNGASVLTYAREGNRTPFYLQPTLGGSDDLRGFSPFRFYGDKKAVINAEYRWEVFTGLDCAVFADGGQMFDANRDFNFRKFELSYGMGFRANVRNIPVMRIDIGVSRESVMVWFKFDNFM